MNAPQVGPLTPRWGPYIRNIQEVGDGIWLVDASRGTKGMGKVWNPTLVCRNPEAGKPYPYGNGEVQPDFHTIGEVSPRHGQYSKGEYRAGFWGAHGRGDVTFADQNRAVKFMLGAAKAFMEATT